MMNEEGAFPRLLELIQERKDDDAGLHRMLLMLLYEMSRIQRLRIEDLSGFCYTNEKMSCLCGVDSVNRRRVHHVYVPDY